MTPLDKNGIEILVGDSIKVYNHSGSYTVKIIDNDYIFGIIIGWDSGGLINYADPYECEVILDDPTRFIKRMPI